MTRQKYSDRAYREDFFMNFIIPTVIYFTVWFMIILVCIQMQLESGYFLLLTVINALVYGIWLDRLNKKS